MNESQKAVITTYRNLIKRRQELHDAMRMLHNETEGLRSKMSEAGDELAALEFKIKKMNAEFELTLISTF